MAEGSRLRSRGETWGPVSPDHVHETGVSPGGRSGSPHRGRGGGAGRANSKKDVVKSPDPRFLCLTGSVDYSAFGATVHYVAALGVTPGTGRTASRMYTQVEC